MVPVWLMARSPRSNSPHTGLFGGLYFLSTPRPAEPSPESSSTVTGWTCIELALNQDAVKQLREDLKEATVIGPESRRVFLAGRLDTLMTQQRDCEQHHKDSMRSWAEGK
jgi:hypothetical protein